MKKILFIIFLVLVTDIILAGKKVTLPEIMKPNTIAVHNNHFYITDNATIYIYSLKDFKLKKKFGKKGEGPQEFMVNIGVGGLNIFFNSGKLQVNSMGKVSFFSTDGNFIKEIKHSVLFGAAQFYPLGSKFVCAVFKQEKNKNIITINIYNSDLKKEKLIGKYNISRAAFERSFTLQSINNKIFIAQSKNFVIDVFNDVGKKLYSIRQEYKKVEFTNKDKEEVLNWYKTNPATKQFYEMFKKRMVFPSYFASIKNFIISDKKIYVQTFLKKENSIEFLIFDLKGRFLKRVWLPIIKNNPIEIFQLFTIKKGKLYQLIENENNEMWELDITEIK